MPEDPTTGIATIWYQASSGLNRSQKEPRQILAVSQSCTESRGNEWEDVDADTGFMSITRVDGSTVAPNRIQRRRTWEYEEQVWKIVAGRLPHPRAADTALHATTGAITGAVETPACMVVGAISFKLRTAPVPPRPALILIREGLTNEGYES